jgi:uncharacterized protein (DUF488 family)
MSSITLFTIGFTKKNAKTFFEKIREARVKCLIDVRLNNASQLAGFSKRDDLIYFLDKLCDCRYKHIPEMAPTKEILDAYKKNKISWNDYEIKYNKLIQSREVENIISKNDLNLACFLCSEHTPENCHRKLLSEHFQKIYPDLYIKHL